MSGGGTEIPNQQKREVSRIEFPYSDLDDAIAVTSAVRAVGGSSCSIEQLAAFLKLAPDGGGFRLRVSGARIFGLITNERGTVTVTELGARICDPITEKQARVDAFLTVPLYRAVYEKFRGATLPPPTGLEAEMVSMGVAVKQKDKARQVFARAAKQAGFLDLSSDRLVIPPIRNVGPAPMEEVGRPDPVATSNTLQPKSSFHPFVEGLLQKLPPTETEWPLTDRRKWLQTAANVFDLMYATPAEDGDKAITIQVS